MANAVEASASTARPRKLKKGAAQGETAAARRDGVQQGNCQRTKEGESRQTPEERTSDRDLGAPSPATVPTIPYQGTGTGGEIQGEEHKEKTGEQRIPQRWTRRGLPS